jgi:hypothetical protein
MPLPEATSSQGPPFFPPEPFVKIIFSEYVCVKLVKRKLKEFFAHKTLVAFHCRFNT